MGNEHLDHEDSHDAELEALLGSLDDADLNPPAPPAGLWDRISAEIADDGQMDHGGTDDAAGDDRPTLVDVNSNPSDRPARARRPSWIGLAAAAAVVLVVAGFVTWFATRTSSRVVATAQLQHEADFDPAGATATASAELIERDGMYLISLRNSDLPNELGEPADLELWLIEADPDGNLDVQPVAVIDHGDGTYSVPDGLDPVTHNIVDISIEPRDGDVAHSGRSILRGALVEV